MVKKLLMICLTVVMTLSLCACGEEEGSVEKAGKEVDKAFDTMKEKVHEATE